MSKINVSVLFKFINDFLQMHDIINSDNECLSITVMFNSESYSIRDFIMKIEYTPLTYLEISDIKLCLYYNDKLQNVISILDDSNVFDELSFNIENLKHILNELKVKNIQIHERFYKNKTSLYSSLLNLF